MSSRATALCEPAMPGQSWHEVEDENEPSEADLLELALNQLSTPAELESPSCYPMSTLDLPSSPARHQLASGVRCCLRCSKLFSVNPTTGVYETNEPCRYHPGSVVTDELSGIRQFSCCDRISNPYTEKQGCYFGVCHLHDCRMVDYSLGEFDPYQEGGWPVKADVEPSKLFSLGIGPVFTINGVEYGKVAVIDSEFHTVFQSAIGPIFRVTDYNSAVTGLTEDANDAPYYIDIRNQLMQAVAFDQALILLGPRWRVAQQFLSDLGIWPARLRIIEKSDYQMSRYAFRNLSGWTPLGEAVHALHALTMSARNAKTEPSN